MIEFFAKFGFGGAENRGTDISKKAVPSSIRVRLTLFGALLYLAVGLK